MILAACSKMYCPRPADPLVSCKKNTIITTELLEQDLLLPDCLKCPLSTLSLLISPPLFIDNHLLTVLHCKMSEGRELVYWVLCPWVLQRLSILQKLHTWQQRNIYLNPGSLISHRLSSPGVQYLWTCSTSIPVVRIQEEGALCEKKIAASIHCNTPNPIP